MACLAQLADNQVRYAMATNSLENGLGHIRQNILDLENMINEYNKMSDSSNNPQYLINLQQKISNSIEVIKLNSNSLKQYAASVTSSNKTTDINVERIDNNLNEILIEDSKLETIEKRFIENAQLPNNPYTLIDDDKMEEIFDKEVLPVANAVPINATGDDNDNDENDVNDDENEEDNNVDPTAAGESENNNPLGPPDGNSADDGTPPDLDIDKLPSEQADEIRSMPSWLDGAAKRWQGVGKIILGGTLKIFTFGRLGDDEISEGRSLLREADKIQRDVLNTYFKLKK